MENKNDLKILMNNRTKIMGFAALLILYFHTWMPIISNTSIISKIELFTKRIGFLGVDIFLLLSGMGLVNSIKKDTKKFYYNRVKRIMFTYILVSIYALLINHWTLLEYIQNIFFYNYFTKSIYSFLWYIPTIFIFYLFFPIYYKLFNNSKNKKLFIILSLCIWFLLALLLKGIIREEVYGIINRIPIFITGIWIGWFIKNKEFKIKKIYLLINIIILIIGLYLAYLTNFKGFYVLLPVSNSLVNYLIALPITIILAYLFEKCHLKCINAFFEFYGTISLQLYCIQELVFNIVYPTIMYFHSTSILLLINILYFAFVTFIAKIILILDQLFWNKIEHKKLQPTK